MVYFFKGQEPTPLGTQSFYETHITKILVQLARRKLWAPAERFDRQLSLLPTGL